MRRTSHFFKQLRRFVGTNSRLFLFLGLLLVGVIVGCRLAPHMPQSTTALIQSLSISKTSFSGVTEVFSVFWQGSLVFLVAIGLLMLSGMSLCGIPAVLCIPALCGVWIGLFESVLLATRGMQALALALPGTLLAVWAVLIACAEAFRLTLRLVAQVMPGTPKTGLWRDFRLFFLRFLLCFLLAFLASAIQTTTAVLF